MTRAAVFGAGSWGTTFGKVLVEAGTSTTLWGRRADLVEAIQQRRENLDYLPGVRLPAQLRATADPEEALTGADLVVLAIPAQSLRDTVAQWAGLVPAHATVVSLTKGVEVGTLKRMSEVVEEVAKVPRERIAVLSGPNLAKEILQRQPAAAVVACCDEQVAARVQAACTTGYFRVYTNLDVVGTELAGAAKNVIALSVGMAIGLGFGDNSKASLITRGLAETTRLGVALGADPLTFAGLAGLGDLVATCMSPLSRNRTVGEQLGRGRSLGEIRRHMHMVAEGVQSSEAILELAHRTGVDVPIVEHVVAVIRGELSVEEIAASLMARELRSERHDG